MKNKWHLLILILIFQFNASAQDLILTKNNDSISCKIKSFKEDNIIYQSFEEKTYTINRIAMDEVADTIFNFYIQTNTNSNLLSQQHSHYLVTIDHDTIYCNLIQKRSNYLLIEEMINGKFITKGIPRFKIQDINRIKKDPTGPKNAIEFQFNLGYANRIISSNSYIIMGYFPYEVLAPALNGTSLKGSASYYFKYHYGIGVSYNEFRDYYINKYSTIKTHIKFSGLIASYVYYPSKGKFKFGAHLGIGQFSYKEYGYRQTSERFVNEFGYYEYVYSDIEYESKGKAFGSLIAIDFSYFFIKNLGINISSDLLFGHLKKVNSVVVGEEIVETFEDNKGISLNQIQLSGGLILRF